MVLMLITFIGTIMAIGVFVFHHQIPYMLVNDRESIERASHALMIWAPFELIEGLNCVTQGIFRGAGRQHLAAGTNAIAYYMVGIPIAYVLAFQMDCGIEGLWLGFGAGLTVSVTTLLCILKRSSWSQMALEAQARTAQ
jgi:MATE family multidrug resistance protein